VCGTGTAPHVRRRPGWRPGPGAARWPPPRRRGPADGGCQCGDPAAGPVTVTVRPAAWPAKSTSNRVSPGHGDESGRLRPGRRRAGVMFGRARTPGVPRWLGVGRSLGSRGGLRAVSLAVSGLSGFKFAWALSLSQSRQLECSHGHGPILNYSQPDSAMVPSRSDSIYRDSDSTDIDSDRPGRT
jgi:hypothetical protein